MRKKLLFVLIWLLLGSIFGLPYIHAAYELEMGFSVDAGISSGVTGASNLHHFPNLTITGSGNAIRVVRIMFTRPVDTGTPSKDQIKMATLPAGWTEQTAGTPSPSTQHGRVYAISQAEGTPAKVQTALKDFLRVHYEDPGKPGQEVMIILDEDATNATRRLYYSAATTHFYELIPYATYSGTSGNNNWIKAYNYAIKRTYMGLTGYLATVTSQAEQNFIQTVANGAQGWIGGTRYQFAYNPDGTISALTSSLSYWYWACGPEWELHGKNPEQSKFNNTETGLNTTGIPNYPYNAWNSGEPNNGGGEYYVQLVRTGLWNDLNGSQTHDALLEFQGILSESNIGKGTIGYENSTKNARINNGNVSNGSVTMPDTLVHDDVITYSIEPVNISTFGTSITVIDELPNGLEVIPGSISSGGVYDLITHTITWTDLPLNPNTVFSPPLTFQVKLTAGQTGDDPLRNRATVITKGSMGDVRLNTNSTYHKGFRCTVTYQTTAGGSISGTPNPQIVDYNLNLPAGITAAPAVGYRLSSWSHPAYNTLKGAIQQVDTVADYTAMKAFGNMTVYANFETIAYTLYYNLNNGINHASNPDTYTVTDAFTLQPPTRLGYHFTGWTDDDNSNAPVTGIVQGTTGDKHFSANWEEIKVNLVASDSVCNATVMNITFTSPVYTGNPTVSYEWTAAGYAVIGLTTNSGTGNIAFTATNAGLTPLTDTITVTPKIGTNAGTPLKFAITVLPSPQFNALGDTVICSGETVFVVFSTNNTGIPVEYDWSYRRPGTGEINAGTGNIAFTPPANNGSTPIVDTVIVTPKTTAGNACSGAHDTFLVTVNPAPVMNVVNDTTVCNGGTVATHFSTPVTGATVTYHWTSSNPQVDVAQIGNGTGDISFVAVNTGLAPVSTQITVVPKIAATVDSCAGASVQYTVTVLPMPQMDAVNDTIVCNGTQLSIIFGTPITNATVEYAWNSSNPNVLPGSGKGNIVFAAVNNGTQSLTTTIVVTPRIAASVTDTCSGTTRTFTITVNPTPQVNPINNLTLCNNDVISASFSSANTGVTTTYAWSYRRATVGEISSGTGDMVNVPAMLNSGNTSVVDTVIVIPTIVSGGNVCSGVSERFLVTVNPTATIYALADTTYYDGQSVTARTIDSPVSGATFAWTNTHASIGLAVSGTGASIPAFTAVNTGQSDIVAIITVTPTFNGCVGTPFTIQVTIKPRPTITYDYDNGTPPTTANPTSYVVGVGGSIANEPTRIGYTFGGWTCNELGILGAVNPLVIPPSATQNLTVKAYWGNAVTYSIAYNDAGTHTNPTTYDVNTPDITLSAPVKAGRRFVGWTGTGLSGTLPHLQTVIPQGSVGDRTYLAHWAYLFASDTVYGCAPPVILQSGHDGQSYEWILPDGSRQTTPDIQATTLGNYVLHTNYGAASMIASDTVYVFFPFDDTLQIRRISSAGTKTGIPQTFALMLNPAVIQAADNISYEWSFPEGVPASSVLDIPTVTYASTGTKTVTLRLTVTLGTLICQKTFTYNYEIFESNRGFFVNQRATGGTRDGRSWENAYLTLREALEYASINDYIWVAEGVYTPDARLSHALHTDSIEIYGGFNGTERYLYERDFAKHPTILRGAGASVVTIDNALTSARLDGFIIEGGNADRGGGIYADSPVTIANSIIRNNQATDGGGIYIASGNAVLYNVVLSGNTAMHGGAMFNRNASLMLTHVTISGNRASATGGGMYNSNASPTIRNSIIWDNRAPESANAHNQASTPVFSHCLIEGANGSGASWVTAIGTDGGGNLGNNPLFRKKGFASDGSMQQGDYHLSGSSPAIDRGLNAHALDIRVRWNVALQTKEELSPPEILPYDLDNLTRIDYQYADMGAYEYTESGVVYPNPVRTVVLPAVKGITTNPPSGIHQVASQQNFVFTLTAQPGYSIRFVEVTTGNPFRDKEGIEIEKTDDNSATVTIRRVTEDLYLHIEGVSPNNTDVADGTKLWSYGRKLYVDTEKTSVLKIYTLSGNMYLEQPLSAGSTGIPLPQGFYTVLLNDKVYKIIIK